MMSVLMWEEAWGWSDMVLLSGGGGMDCEMDVDEYGRGM